MIPQEVVKCFGKHSQIPLSIFISSQPANICSRLSLISTATKLPPSAVRWCGVTRKSVQMNYTGIQRKHGWAEAEMSRIVFTCSLCAPAVNLWSLKNNLHCVSVTENVCCEFSKKLHNFIESLLLFPQLFALMSNN